MMMSGIDPLKWNIGESVLDVLISGVSFLDSKEGFRGAFPDSGSADRFINAYGYDDADPIEIAELQGNIQEAVRFIKKYFLKPENPDGIGIDIPKKINDSLSIRDLLLYSNGYSGGNSELRNWACAILRVVHTISHVDRDMRNNYLGDIQKQIFDRFYRLIHRDEAGVLYLGRNESDPLRVNLVEFQAKPKKARDSILMKLLHKPESVAEELFDRIGVRFITKTRTDAVRAIHFLEQANVIVAANIKPSRSRNTLVDTQAFKTVLTQQLERLKQGEIDEAAMIESLEGIPFSAVTSAAAGGSNRFSSEHYRAIQFTCRQLVKLKNPLSDQLRELKSTARTVGAEAALNPALQMAIDRIDPRMVQRVVRFFYPFEIQAMDELSYAENERGRSAHAEYKKAQQQSAMRRVMGALAAHESIQQAPN
jgi:uncharacterized protein (TIGR04562 family)